MTTVTQLQKSQDGISANHSSVLVQTVGHRKRLTRAQFDSAVGAGTVVNGTTVECQERQNIRSNSVGIFPDGEQFEINGEGGYRTWSVATGGTDAANAAASHARTVNFGNGKTWLVTTDAGVCLLSGSAPAANLGNDGDLCFVQSTYTVYQKFSGQWASVLDTAMGHVTGLLYKVDAGSTVEQTAMTYTYVRFNNTTQSASTFIYISNFNNNTIDCSGILSQTSVGQQLRLESVIDETQFFVFQVTSVATPNSGNYRKLGVTLLTQGYSAFPNNALIRVSLTTSALALPLPYSTTIPFNGSFAMPQTALAANTTFTANTTGAVVGGGGVLTLVGNGTAIPTFTGMLPASATAGYFNSANGVINDIVFNYTPSGARYAITQPNAAQASVLLGANNLSELTDTAAAWTTLGGNAKAQAALAPALAVTAPIYHYPTFAAFSAALALKQANAATAPGWADAQSLSNGSEPGVTRRWNATGLNARLVSFGTGKTATVPLDTNVVLFTTGVPSAGTGANGDLSVDWAAGTVYQKTSNAWASILSLGTPGVPGTAGSSVDIQTFLASGTWTKPTSATPKLVRVFLGGGGGGGGSGYSIAAAGTNLSGGSGGGGAALIVIDFTPDQLGATETVSVGAGGTAGVAATSVGGGAGTAGGKGGDSTFGARLFAGGGGAGYFGQSGASSGGGGGGTPRAGTSAFNGTNTQGGGVTSGSGGGGFAAAGQTPSFPWCGSGGGGGWQTGQGPSGGAIFGQGGASGGGAGGGIPANGAATAGGVSQSGLTGSSPNNGGTGAGGAGTTNTTSTTDSSNGGGGGASNANGNAGAGGFGGNYGGGGGGGGSSIGGLGGAGGAGGPGICRVVTFF